jgi:monovalent cation:H+ antiporter, CPA1 family
LSSIASFTLVISAFLLLISIVQPSAERLHLPYTVLLAIVGTAVGGLSSFLLHTNFTHVFEDIVRPIVELPISASVFLIVFLPILLFHAALTIDLREIARDAAPILTLAVFAVVAAAAAIGFSLSLFGVPLILALLLGRSWRLPTRRRSLRSFAISVRRRGSLGCWKEKACSTTRRRLSFSRCWWTC